MAPSCDEMNGMSPSAHCALIGGGEQALMEAQRFPDARTAFQNAVPNSTYFVVHSSTLSIASLKPLNATHAWRHRGELAQRESIEWAWRRNARSSPFNGTKRGHQ